MKQSIDTSVTEHDACIVALTLPDKSPRDKLDDIFRPPYIDRSILQAFLRAVANRGERKGVPSNWIISFGEPDSIDWKAARNATCNIAGSIAILHTEGKALSHEIIMFSLDEIWEDEQAWQLATMIEIAKGAA